MTAFSFGQLVLTSTNPTTAQREAVIRNGLQDHYHNGSYLRVHALSVVSPTTFYSAVSFSKSGQNLLTYVAGSIKCRKKDEGYWLDADCFMATSSVPPYLTDCPREVFEAADATGIATSINQEWYDSCIKSLNVRENIQAFKKGAVFVLNQGSSSPLIAGEAASYAVIVSKNKALFIAPLSGATEERSSDDVAEHYTQIPTSKIRVLADDGWYSSVGGLLFDRSGGKAVLIGRLAKGEKAKLMAQKRKRRNVEMANAIQLYNFDAKFQSGDWLH